MGPLVLGAWRGPAAPAAPPRLQQHAVATTAWRVEATCDGSARRLLGARGALLPHAVVAGAAALVRRRRRGHQRAPLVRPLRAADDSEISDASMFAALRKRADEVKAAETERQELIKANWQDGRVLMGPLAAVDDWVRRVVVLGDDMFVGTASKGVQRYRIGDLEPRQRLRVHGDPNIGVMADHPGGADPETSVNSLAFDGRWLVAGLAGGHVHVWDADGDSKIDSQLNRTSPRPCYVCLNDGVVAAASNCVLRCWHPDPAAGDGVPCREISADLPCRAHSLVAGFAGGFIVGLADGSVEIRGADCELLSRQEAAHESAVSTVCCVDGGFVTGDDDGNVICWNEGSEWTVRWRAKHGGRVVAAQVGCAGIIITGGLDGAIRTWKPETGDLMFLVPGNKIWLGSINVSEDNAQMITDGRDNCVYQFDFAKKPDSDESYEELDDE